MATEKRLIDANAYVDELKWLQAQVSSASAIEIQEYIDRTNRQPAVDAVEVVHGHWNAIFEWNAMFEYEDFQYAHCSACGKRSEYTTRYCPNCGAKMDGERKENNNAEN